MGSGSWSPPVRTGRWRKLCAPTTSATRAAPVLPLSFTTVSTAWGRVRPLRHDHDAQVGRAHGGLALGGVDARRLDDDEMTGVDQRGQHGTEPVGDEQLPTLGGEAAVRQHRQKGLDSGLEELQDVEPFVHQELCEPVSFLDAQPTVGTG